VKTHRWSCRAGRVVDAEPLGDERGVLHRVALGDCLRPEAAQMKRLVRERVGRPRDLELLEAARVVREAAEVDAIDVTKGGAGSPARAR
jgi:hypothetical protein